MHAPKELGSAIALAAGLSLAALPSGAQPIPGKVLHITQTRNLPFCEIAPVVGKPLLVQIYNTTGAGDCPPVLFELLDAGKLAATHNADWVFLNPRRHWMFDQMWSHKTGETKDFDGVRATWMASMEPFYLKEGLKRPFTPMELRWEATFLYEKGKPVFVMRTHEKAVYVLQAYTPHIDRSLSLSTLPGLRVQLKLPPGWRFDIKTLDRDLTFETAKAGGFAHILQDELNNTYVRCGFDATCNYVP